LVPPAFGRLGTPASLAWVYEPVPGCSRRPSPATRTPRRSQESAR